MRKCGFEARNRLREAVARDGLEEVVRGFIFEGLHGVLVVRGHKHDARVALGFLRHFDARLPRHFDVEKRDVRLVLSDHRFGFEAIDRFGHDGQFGPQRGELVAQVFAQKRFVVG